MGYEVTGHVCCVVCCVVDFCCVHFPSFVIIQRFGAGPKRRAKNILNVFSNFCFMFDFVIFRVPLHLRELLMVFATYRFLSQFGLTHHFVIVWSRVCVLVVRVGIDGSRCLFVMLLIIL